jgi:hypothetical protein
MLCLLLRGTKKNNKCSFCGYKRSRNKNIRFQEIKKPEQ